MFNDGSRPDQLLMDKLCRHRQDNVIYLIMHVVGFFPYEKRLHDVRTRLQSFSPAAR